MQAGSTVIVTGGAGFIGSHTCKTLARRGLVPVTYDNLSRGHREAVKFGPLEIGELADPIRLRSVIEKYQPIGVMHFAALTYVAESVEKPALYYSNNVAGTAVLLQALLEYAVLPFVFSSTAAVYGLPQKLPIAEDHPQQPINPYGKTKLLVEHMLVKAGRDQRLPWVSLRYFNAAGSDTDGEIGERHEPETHLIPLVLTAARSGTSVKIFGTDYDTPDGTCVRDFVHVADIADAHVCALEYLLAGGESMALNLANTRGHSVKEVIATSERVCGTAIATQVAPRRDGDPPVLIGAAERARELLGWMPQRSELAAQIADAWRWSKSQM